MLRHVSTAVLAALTVTTLVGATTQHPHVVYGPDDRISASARSGPTGSVAAIIPWGMLERATSTDSYAVDAPHLGDQLNLCPGEPFADEPVAAICTATLVGNDVLLTAGHCALPLICDDYAIVFDYVLNDEGTVDDIPASSVYSCTDIVRRQLASEYQDTVADYGWLRLKAPIDRESADIRACDSADLREGDAVSMIGFAHGTPMKLHENGTVYDDGAPKYETFISSLDASHGDSGAPVFDEYGQLVGVLGQGGSDTYTGPDGCELTNRIPDTAEYAEEQSTYACFALDGFCERVEDEHELCGAPCDGFCDDDPPPTFPDDTVQPCAVTPGVSSSPLGWLALVAGLVALARRRRGPSTPGPFPCVPTATGEGEGGDRAGGDGAVGIGGSSGDSSGSAGDASATAGTSTGATTGATPPYDPIDTPSGCSCEVPSGTRSGDAGWLALGLLGAGIRRRSAA